MHFAAQATRRVLAALEPKLSLTEVEGAGRGPWLMLAGRSTRGAARCFKAPTLDKLALITLEDQEQLDSSMLIAFSAPDSGVPHLMLDVARVGRDFGVFVDLLPRLDLSVHSAYARAVYGPLREGIDALVKNKQLRPSAVPHSLRAFVSPFMTGFRVGTALLPQLHEFVAPFVSHWLNLQQTQQPTVPLSRAELKARDLMHREALFSRDADPAWDVLARAAGEARAVSVLELLRKHGLPAPRDSSHP